MFYATVTYQKCTTIWNFDFEPLRFKIGSYGYVYDRKFSTRCPGGDNARLSEQL